MSESGGTMTGQALPRAWGVVLPAAPIDRPLCEAMAVVLLVPLLLSVAFWNGFPIIFYDTGAYMLQGIGHVFIAERSPVYSLFLAAAGGGESLWFVAIAQSVMTAFVLTETARVLRPNMSLWMFLALVACVVVTTGLPWYVGQIEPDCFVALVPLTIYVLAFHGKKLDPQRASMLLLVAAFAIASHPSHIALAGGLLLALAAMRIAPEQWIELNRLPRPRLALAGGAVALALATVAASNYALTNQLFLSRSGAVFLEARLMEDGLIAPVLDATCPKAGYRLCAYRHRLPQRADAWLWEEKASPFRRLGGFRKMESEATALVAESMRRYPWRNFAAALADTAVQLFWFQTGDGIVPQEWVLNREFKLVIPRQVADYDHAYQQEGAIWFLPVNFVHVPVAIFSLAGIFLLLRNAVRRRVWRGALLAGFVLLALLGNAFVCGVFSGPHARYQSRIMWLPSFAVLLILEPRIAREARRRRLPEMSQ